MTQGIDLGKAIVHPDTPITAGTFTTIWFTYTVGHCIDDSGYIRICFRHVGDFGTPQFDQPEAPNFCTVQTNGDCRIEPRWDPKGNTRPWDKCLYLKIMGGYLDVSEQVTVTFGDRSQGSPGWFSQTFAETSFEFKTYVDCFATYRFKELPESPVMRIVPGNPVALSCVAPSIVARNSSFSYFTRLQDAWGNIIEEAAEHSHPGYPEEGTQRISVRDDKTGLKAVSNPICVVAEQDSLRYWWGDLHGQSEETIGTNTIEDYFRYARDFSRIDIAGHQGNDFQITDEFWDAINSTTAKFNRPGSFVTFPGYEWSGNTPLGGDRNVYFREEGREITRSHHDLLNTPHSKYPLSPTANDLFSRLKGKDSFVFAHVGGRYANLSMHSEEIEVGMEIHSAWGTFEWLLDEALERGYRIGICANSDDNKGRPGASYPGAGSFGSLGGLTCFLAEKLDRDHFYDAIMKRHFYATTGNRPILRVHANFSDGRNAMMGDVIEIDETGVTLHISAIGTHAIEEIKLINGTEVVESRRPYSEEDLSSRIKVAWSGAEVRGRDRMANNDGSLIIEGNTILGVAPVNFWNPLKRLIQTGPAEVSWESITTRGLAGIIIQLAEHTPGLLRVKLNDIHVEEEIRYIGITPKVYKYGGLDKKMELYRLPSEGAGYKEFHFNTHLVNLKKGQNSLYVKVAQEDGHLAWSSPIYILRSKMASQR